MTSWQDQQARGGAGRIGDDSGSGRPVSRRAAREAERRAAEAVQERQPHPSGVVDFQAHDFGSEFAPDQDFNVGDTQDIWAALTRGEGRRSAQGQPSTVFPVAASPAPPQTGETASVSGELLDRVRDAVLRRAPEQVAPERAPTPLQVAPHTVRGPQPQAFVPQHRPPIESQPAAPSDIAPGSTRRERRQREQAAAREDDLPADLFVGRASPAAPPIAHLVAPAVDVQDDDDYASDGPYSPEPTAVIASLRPMELDAPSSTTNPGGLPQSFAEPAGDDALTFSNPVQVVPAEPMLEHPAATASAAFVAPAAWDAPSLGPVPTPRPMQAPSPFLEPQQPSSRFTAPEIGPPSEVTDLAGFEALIRRARQQPAAPQPEQRPALAWADDEEVQEGFTGVIGRSVQGSHGSPNALILPNDPQPVDVTQAVSGTGDIFVTGSMNLSRSLSTTGATSDYDSHDIDRLFDGAQDEPATGVAPVRASRAVSGTDQHRAIVSGHKSHGTLLPTILAVVAGALAVGVVALLIGSRLTGIF